MFNTKFISLGASLYAMSLLSHAGPVERYMQQQLEAKNSIHSMATIQQYHFQQLIDHNNPARGSFSQRYYIDEHYGPETNAPVFFYICGEATCNPSALNGAIRHYAQKFHAKLIALEHRYYGASIPVTNLSTKNLRFLTTEAALDDLAYFQRHISQQKNWTGSWIAFGGSYPGSLSAYYRLKFPYLVAGALASSAPVMAKEDFIEYDQHVTEVVGPQCAELMREVVHTVEASLDDPSQLAQIKELFGASNVVDPIDFLYLIADIGAGAVQYGEKEKFCATLASRASPLIGYAEIAHDLYKSSGLNAVDFTAQGAMDETINPDAQGLSMRQWYYQSCTEYGYWQNAHPNPQLSTRSTLINLDYHHQVCKRLFQLTQPAQTTNLNATFYYPLMDALVSKIFFTNGEQDPWSTLSLAEKNGNASNSNLNYQLILGAAHCDDLHRPSLNDSASLQQARKTMELLLSQWLANG